MLCEVILKLSKDGILSMIMNEGVYSLGFQGSFNKVICKLLSAHPLMELMLPLTEEL